MRRRKRSAIEFGARDREIESWTDGVYDDLQSHDGASEEARELQLKGEPARQVGREQATNGWHGAFSRHAEGQNNSTVARIGPGRDDESSQLPIRLQWPLDLLAPIRDLGAVDRGADWHVAWLGVQSSHGYFVEGERMKEKHRQQRVEAKGEIAVD